MHMCFADVSRSFRSQGWSVAAEGGGALMYMFVYVEEMFYVLFILSGNVGNS